MCSAAFETSPREAETEARTIEELQAQVDTLTRQLRKAQKGVAIAPPVDVEKIRAEVRSRQRTRSASTARSSR
jgi:hypothetical protein